MSSDISVSDAMAIRYPPEVLIHLRDSPLCVKPPSLPPAEEWMGPPPENFRNSQGNKANTDRPRHNDASLLEQANRRPGVDRHISRNNANPEDIVLGPPRLVFNSATTLRNTKQYDNDKTTKEGDARDRFSFRSRNSETDANEQRFRDRDRDSKNNFRRRGDGDQDSDGWSTVKPRKSFGAEGAERFHGRMGDRPSPGTPERFGAERRQREGDDRDNNTDRPRRNFGDFTREKEGDDGDKLRKNGNNKMRADHPWNRDTEANQPTQPRERFDRTKSWRDRTDDTAEAQTERPRERQYERRWDRDQRQEREPEWLDEPSEERGQAHTQEDFKKFMETMKAKTSASKAQAGPALTHDVLKAQDHVDADVTKPLSTKPTHAIELGADKFFAAFAQKTTLEGSGSEPVKENAAPAPIPKSGSRFQNFFSSQEQSRTQPEPSTPAPAPVGEINPLVALAGSPKAGTQQDAAEKVAFQALLQKLQKQTIQASTPPSAGFAEPPPSHDFGPKIGIPSPGPFQQYGQESRDDAVHRAPPQAHDIHPPLPPQNAQFPAMRPEQQILLHDLIGQRHPSQNSGGQRVEPSTGRSSNPNTEFLVSLMQGGRNMPEPQRNEQLVMRMPQPSRPAQIPPTTDRDADFQHERSSSQHQANVRPAGLSSFFDEQPLLRPERETRPQPTHILQRPGQVPPGLDQMPPSNWMQTGGQQMPMPGRPMIPPPGLPGSQRAMPPPGNYPNFPMGGFPPDAMSGPPRNMAPPPGFFNGPPPGFMPHPGLGGFQGPESLGFGFDGRGMPPPGAGAPFRRN